LRVANKNGLFSKLKTPKETAFAVRNPLSSCIVKISDVTLTHRQTHAKELCAKKKD